MQDNATCSDSGVNSFGRPQTVDWMIDGERPLRDSFPNIGAQSCDLNEDRCAMAATRVKGKPMLAGTSQSGTPNIGWLETTIRACGTGANPNPSLGAYFGATIRATLSPEFGPLSGDLPMDLQKKEPGADPQNARECLGVLFYTTP